MKLTLKPISKLSCLSAIMALGLVACNAPEEAAHATGDDSIVKDANAAGETPIEAGASEDAIAAALANEWRPDEDKTDDAARKPGAVLAFTGIAPGMAVFEIEAGSGYYTELISRIVGPDGSVVMQNPESFDSFLGDAIPKRLADDRLSNVRLSKTNFDTLEAEDA